MKKNLFLLFFATILILGLDSCSKKDEPGNGLVGNWYVWNLPQVGQENRWDGKAYYFENGNTVRYYDNIAGYPHWGAVPTYSTALPSPMNGYYAQALFEYTTYTYEIIDNKLYIPLQGVIITISGNNLVQDGGLTFTKK